MSFSDYWENAILDHVFGKTAYTAPAHIYVGLSTADPGDDGAGVAEPVGGDYARIETDPADWTAASGGVISNSALVTFAVPSGDWGTITHVFLSDASTGGNVLGSSALPTPQVTSAGSLPPNFAIGSIVAALT